MMINEPMAIRKRIREYAQGSYQMTTAQRGAVIGEVIKALKVLPDLEDLDAARRLIFGWLFLPEDQMLRELSSKEMTGAMFHGLRQWIGAKGVEVDGKTEWIPRAEFAPELHWLLARVNNHFTVSGYYNPRLTIGQVFEVTVSDKMKERLDIEAGGAVAAGFQLGASEVEQTDEISGDPCWSEERVAETLKTAQPKINPQMPVGAFVGSLDDL